MPLVSYRAEALRRQESQRELDALVGQLDLRLSAEAPVKPSNRLARPAVA